MSDQISLLVKISEQTLTILKGDSTVDRFFISTSKFGEGFEEGSHQTPLGNFTISEKIGGGEAAGTVFKGRQPVGNWKDSPELFDAHADLILTRILWLEGIDETNQNTKARYIYLHGTNQEPLLGKKASWGCIRVGEQDLLKLFECCELGTTVKIVL